MTASSMAAEGKEVEIAKRRKKATLSPSLPPSNGQQILSTRLPLSLLSLPLGHFPVSWASTSSEFGKRKRENTAFTVFCTITPSRLCHFAHSARLINYPSAICLNENFLPCCTE